MSKVITVQDGDFNVDVKTGVINIGTASPSNEINIGDPALSGIIVGDPANDGVGFYTDGSSPFIVLSSFIGYAAFTGIGGSGAPTNGDEVQDAGVSFARDNTNLDSVGFVGYPGTKDFTIQADNYGAHINVVSTSTAGTQRTVLVGDPDLGVDLYYQGAVVARSTATGSGGFLVDNGSGLAAVLTANSGVASVSGTPVNNQLAVWTDATTIEGDANFLWDSATSTFTLGEATDKLAIDLDGTDINFSVTSLTGGDMNFTGVPGRYIFSGNNNFDSGEIRHQAFGDPTEWIEMGHTGATVARITASDSIFLHPNSGQVNIDRVPLRITNPTLGTAHGVFSHDDTDFNLDFLTTTDYNVGSGLSGNIKAQKSISILEAAAAIADTATFGQIWVKDDIPNTLMFTDDTGQDIQISPYRATLQTTAVTTTEIISIPVASGSGFGFEIHIIGTEDSTGDTVFERIFGAIRNQATATALVGSTVVDRTDDAGATTWVITVAADDGTDALTVDVAGEAAHTIDWKVSVNLLNV